MKTILKIGLSLIMLVHLPVSAADLEAGKAKSAMCAGCHGSEGLSGNAQYPHLAGQKPAYIVAQLKAFKTKKRTNPMMQAMASQLSDTDMVNLADFYASLENNSVNTQAKPNPDAAAKLGMCMGCHGNEFQGRGSIPRLTNQYPEYLAIQLQSFKNKTRTGGAMPAIAASLSDQDITELSIYLGTLSH